MPVRSIGAVSNGGATRTTRLVRDQGKLESLGITPRELEILKLIAAG